MIDVITIEDTPEPSRAPPPPPPPAQGTSASAYASTSRSYGPAHPEPALKKRKSDGTGDQNGYHDNQSNGNGYRSALPSGSYASTGGYASANGQATGSRAAASSKNKRKHDAYDGYSNGRDSVSSRDSAQRPSQRAKEKELPVNDKEGHFIVRVGDAIGSKYRITRPLGQGTFGKVVCCKNTQTGAEVAIKVIRAVPKYREASKVEVKVLQLIKRNDPQNQHKCITLLETFEHKNHVCLVTELLSSSVFDFLKDNAYQPFPLAQIQDFARQLFESVDFLHRMQLIHTDLKPENILLESVAATEVDVVSTGSKKSKPKKILKSTAIRLIDFGSATFENEYHATVVSTRHYRAPEIILGTGWSYECDVWSIGCILIEFFTGEALFQTHENVEHLAMMERVFGKMPDDFRQAAWKAVSANGQHPDWFKTTVVDSKRNVVVATDLNFPVTKASTMPNAQAVTSKQSIKFVKQMKELKHIVPDDESIGAARFLNLLEKLLQWEPKQRLKVKDALRHPFFNMKISNDL